MKIGIRKFNLKKRIKARTTSRIKREVKKSFIPFYGKKGMGWINNPHKAVYNKIYNKTTISIEDTFKLFLEGDKLNIDEYRTYINYCDRKTRKQLNKELRKYNKKIIKEEIEKVKQVHEDFKPKFKELFENLKKNEPVKFYKNKICFKLLAYIFVGLTLSGFFPVPIGIIFFLTIPFVFIYVYYNFKEIDKKYKR